MIRILKALIIAYLALIVQNAVCIAENLENELCKLDFNRAGDNGVNVTIYTSKSYNLRLNPVKRENGEFIIFLPGVINSLKSKPDISNIKDLVKDVNVRFNTYAEEKNGYTKIILLPNSENIDIRADYKDKSQNDRFEQDIMEVNQAGFTKDNKETLLIRKQKQVKANNSPKTHNSPVKLPALIQAFKLDKEKTTLSDKIPDQISETSKKDSKVSNKSDAIKAVEKKIDPNPKIIVSQVINQANTTKKTPELRFPVLPIVIFLVFLGLFLLYKMMVSKTRIKTCVRPEIKVEEQQDVEIPPIEISQVKAEATKAVSVPSNLTNAEKVRLAKELYFNEDYKKAKDILLSIEDPEILKSINHIISRIDNKLFSN